MFFIPQVRELYPTLPLLANLRCGLWYVRPEAVTAAVSSCEEGGAGCRTPPVPTCYFKSTDGHTGNWSFSTTRMNLHVAEEAARQGGVIIVDATRKGKVRRRFILNWHVMWRPASEVL
jgi:tRNA A64-2'-O-ribosylphosphate transferase